MTVHDLPYPFNAEKDLSPFAVPRVNNYKRAGWKSLIPLPYGKQDPPPVGYTGRNPTLPKNDQYKEWLARVAKTRQGVGNIAIVHNELTVSIDVDDYEFFDKKTGETKRKRGGESLAALEEVLGPLPDTWRSTARGFDNPSGQRFFRIKPEQSPKLLDWDDKPGPHIEIVRWGHRYSVVWPSMNGRLGQVYRWYRPDGSLAEDIGSGEHTALVPEVEDLPYLPDAWVDYLTRGLSAYKDTPRVDLDDEDAGVWIDGRPEADGEPCQIMRKVIDRAIEEMPNGAHDCSRDRLMELFHLAHEGHIGLRTAVGELQFAFFEEVKGRRSNSAARNEWYREFKGAVERAAARPDPATAPCSCWDAAADGDAPVGADYNPARYELNDSGNAEHLMDLVDKRMIWGSGHENWLVWDEEDYVWRIDETNSAMAQARRLAPVLKKAAMKLFAYAKGLDPDSPEGKTAGRDGKELWDFARQTGNLGRLNAMLQVARSLPGVSVPMHKFDNNPYILTCLGSTLELLPRGTPEGDTIGVRERQSELEDYSMNYTGLEYFPWNTLVKGDIGQPYLHGREMWQDYLDTFIPDLELRSYVQRLLGYSLLGSNPERKIVFFQGRTSTGKSTILEAVSAALGRYAKTFNLSMFREGQTEGPRPDIVEALTRRIIITTEGDNEWHLHADTIKRMVGGVDMIKARNLHSNLFLERSPAFVPFVATNSSPTITGADSALWQRVVVVPFDIQMIGDAQKKNASVLLQTDPSARLAVLSWLVEGYVMYAREGLDNPPEAVLHATEAFKEGVSEWHSFMADTLARDPKDAKEDSVVLVQEVYDQYRMWCVMQDVPDKSRLSKKQFDLKLPANGYALKRRRVSSGSQNKANYIIGWHWRDVEEEERSMADIKAQVASKAAEYLKQEPETLAEGERIIRLGRGMETDSGR